MNVRQYFEQVFPTYVPVQPDDLNILDEMPIKSGCGNECRRAIDAAKPLLNHVKQAYGDASSKYPPHPKGHEIRQAIAAGVCSVCICYIRG